MNNALAIIPARGGSKGIPRKNLLPIDGKPLIAWTIEAAKGCPHISRLVVSSDDEEILVVSRSLGAETLSRPAELAGDKIRSEPVAVHALEMVGKDGILPEWMVYLQPTSPLRTAKHITSAFEVLFASAADGLISVYEADNKFLKAYRTTPEGYLAGAVNNDFPNWNRQDLPKIYLPNGALYIMRTKDFLEQPRFWNEKTIPFVMGEEESIDLDTPEDITVITALLKKR